MKSKILFLSMLLFGVFTFSTVVAEEEKRNVGTFSEIALNLSAKLYVTQGEDQSVRIIAKESTLEEIKTEVNGRKLTIRMSNKTIFKRNFNPGKIEIYITVPEIGALSVSGSGVIEVDELKSRILQLAVSGSGNINIKETDSKKVKASISGSGNINMGKGGIADELSIFISGSGNYNGKGFEANEVSVQATGSGSSYVNTNGSIKARIAGSGDVMYTGNPSIDSSILGSGKVKEM